MQTRPDIRSLGREDLQATLSEWREPRYRADQILHWLHRQAATGWEEMTNLPVRLRERLAGHFSLTSLQLVRHQGAADSTQKFLWRLHDGALIESVLIPASVGLYGDASDRRTACLSTQVGCAYGCRFCASGLGGWKRDLGVEEIVGQVLAIERFMGENLGHSQDPAIASGEKAEASPSRAVGNIVIMGMGEPLANYERLLQALRILNAAWGYGVGARKITISTSGLVPQIRRLAEEPFQFGLAISLHGATDEVRNRLMPVNRKYPLARLTEACEDYVSRRGRMLTFEYILIAGVNDALTEVKPLATLARGLKAKVNLIPYNSVEGLPWRRPGEAEQQAFLRALESAGVSVTLRREKGNDIDAACGQLRLRTEENLSA